jgi:hypothetical protein
MAKDFRLADCDFDGAFNNVVRLRVYTADSSTPLAKRSLRFRRQAPSAPSRIRGAHKSVR